MARLTAPSLRAFLVIGAAVFAGAGITLLFIPAVPIDQSACNEIQPGMTVADVESIIGGKPGHYDGVTTYGSSAPSPKEGYWPVWVGNKGEIVLKLGAGGRVEESQLYTVSVLSRSESRFFWERITRNGFGTNRVDLVEAIWKGICIGLGLAGPLLAFAVSCRSVGARGCGFSLCVFGVIGSLIVVVFCVEMMVSSLEERYFPWIGMGSSGLVLFMVGSIVTGRR